MIGDFSHNIIYKRLLFEELVFSLTVFFHSRSLPIWQTFSFLVETFCYGRRLPCFFNNALE